MVQYIKKSDGSTNLNDFMVIYEGLVTNMNGYYLFGRGLTIARNEVSKCVGWFAPEAPS